MRSFNELIENPNVFIRGYMVGLVIGATSMFLFGLLILKSIGK